MLSTNFTFYSFWKNDLVYNLLYLNHLEEEAIFIMREVVASFERPNLLFSGVKTPTYYSGLQKKPLGKGAFLFL